VGIEYHTALRFAWLSENLGVERTSERAFTPLLTLIHTLYNLVFWVFLLPFFTRMEYGTGFILFNIVIGVRLIFNFYTNNLLKPTPEGYLALPFRIP
jgi:hypothetical protein